MILKFTLIILLCISVLVLIFSNFGKNYTKVYDCELAEISPDYPPEVKNECRRLRYEMWLRDQEEYKKRTMI